MARVVVRAFGAIRDLVGSREVEIQVGENRTIKDVLRLLVKKHGKVLEDRVFHPSTQEPNPHIRLLLNGQNIALLKGVETTVRDRDVIAIFPPAGGG